MIRRRPNLTALIATLGFLATGAVAKAQGWYYVNGQPAAPAVAELMAAEGLPFGSYWLQPNGNWGVARNSDVVGNIYGFTYPKGLIFDVDVAQRPLMRCTPSRTQSP